MTKKKAPHSSKVKSSRNKNDKKSPKSSTAESKEKPKGKNSTNDIWNPLVQLSGKKLRKLAIALTNAEVNPQQRALTNQIKALQGARNTDVGNLERLGTQATGNISSYYKSLAESEAQNLFRQKAIGGRARQEVSDAGTQANAQITQAGQTANQNLQNSPSAARDQLQAMIAAQQGRQSREQQTLASAASGQSANYEGLLQAMAQSNQSRGATNVSNTSRQSLADIAKTQGMYNTDIQKALSQRAGLSSDASALLMKNLSNLRGGEREFFLGKGALGIKKSEAENSSSYQDFALKQQQISGKQDAKSRKGQKNLAGIYGKQHKQQQGFANKYQANQGGGSGGKDTSRWREALDIIHNSDRTPKELTSVHGRRAAIGYLVNRNYSHSAAKKAVRVFTKKRRNSQRASGAFGPASGRH